MNISDIIRVPFGYLLDWLYQFTANYGLALILFSLIVKLVLDVPNRPPPEGARGQVRR